MPSLFPALIHLDFHPSNVLVKGEVTGVLDWENVRLGDARADVARTLSILSVDPAVSKLPRAGRQLRRRFRLAYLAGYVSLTGENALAELKPYLAWAGDFMRRDLASRLKPEEALMIERWTRRWAG